MQPSIAISDSDVSYALIEFKVNKSWIADNGYDKALIKLKRLKEGVWSALPLTPLNETELAYTYSAESPGFSVFVITAEKTKISVKPVANKTGTAAPINTTIPVLAASTTANTTKETMAAMPETGSITMDTGIILLATLTGTVLAPALSVYILRKRKRKL